MDNVERLEIDGKKFCIFRGVDLARSGDALVWTDDVDRVLSEERMRRCNEHEAVLALTMAKKSDGRPIVALINGADWAFIAAKNDCLRFLPLRPDGSRWLEHHDFVGVCIPTR